MNRQAVVVHRHTKQCDICLLVDAGESRNIKFFTYKDRPDKYICEHCRKDLKELRKKCHQKIDNPNHNIFANWLPWFAKEIPGMMCVGNKK